VFTDITAVCFYDTFKNENVMSFSNLWIWVFSWKFIGKCCAWNASRRQTRNFCIFFSINFFYF